VPPVCAVEASVRAASGAPSLEAVAVARSGINPFTTSVPIKKAGKIRIKMWPRKKSLGGKTSPAPP